MIEFTKIEQTCFACPSQWDAWDAEGNYYYIRYRYGHLSVDKDISKLEWENATDWSRGIIFSESVGDSYDGVMSEQEMLKRIGATVVL